MAIRKQPEESGHIVIEKVQTGVIHIALVGTTPIILNRMSEKVWRELLYPRGRKTAAEKQSSIKHIPLDEYRASPYTLPDGDTYLAIMSSSIKEAMKTAALDLPGAKKAQIGRLVYIEGDYTPLYGIPKLFMSVARMADINHTPDVRTRAIVPQWAVLAKIRFVIPLLNKTSILNLLSAAGLTAGLGDWRPEKGHGNYGQFEVYTEDDPRFIHIKETGGRDVQLSAMENPECYDEDSQRLLTWWKDEFVLRGKERNGE